MFDARLYRFNREHGIIFPRIIFDDRYIFEFNMSRDYI
jgi:hypothetical protein